MLCPIKYFLTIMFAFLIFGCVSKETQINNKELSVLATRIEKEHPRFSNYKGVVRVIECKENNNKINCEVEYNTSINKAKESINLDKPKEDIPNSFYISQYECDQNKVYCIMLETNFHSEKLSQEEIVQTILKQTEVIIEKIKKKE